MEARIRARLRPASAREPAPAQGAALRRFGVGSGLALMLWFGLLLPLLVKHSYPLWPWLAGSGLLIAGLVAPQILRPLYTPWIAFVQLLAQGLALFITSAAFFLVITPAGWLMRLSGRDPMARRFDVHATSYRVRSRPTDPASMERPF